MRRTGERAGWFASAWATFVGLVGCAPPVDEGAVRGSDPDALVLLVVDTLRRDHLGCYGYDRPTSPNLDAFAARAVRFERAIASAPWTTPSVAALLTSQDPATLGVEDERATLPEEALLLSEVLAGHGFATGAVVSHSFCSSRWNFDQGFDAFDEANVHGHTGESSRGVTEAGLAFLEEHAGAPFFLFLHYFDPHFAYESHGEETFLRAGDGQDYRGPVRDGMPFRELYRMSDRLDVHDLQRLLDLYDAEIAHTDRWIGRILERLAQPDLVDRAVVVVTADHGEEFLDHGRLGHAKTLYRELVNVPLLLAGPGLAPAVVERPVGLVDVMPTVLARLGIAPPPGLVGRSLLDPEPAPVFTSTARAGGLRAVVSGERKLVLHEATGRRELYRLDEDPAEQRPRLVEEGDAEAAALFEILEGWEARRRARRLSGEAVELSADDVERLQALGYGGEE